MGDGLGLQGPWGLASLQASIRQRQLDRMAQQQQEFQNQITLRGANRADQQQQILMQEHAAALAERRAAMEQAGRAETSKLYQRGDIVPSGTGLPTTPEMTLPSMQMGRGMPTPGGLSSSLETSTPDTPPAGPMVGTLKAAPDVMSTTTSSPAPTGRLINLGTAEERQRAEDEAKLQKLMTDPGFKTMTPLQQFMAIRPALEKGINIPYQLLTEPGGPPGTPVQVDVGGKGVYTRPSEAIGKPAYHQPTPMATVTLQTQDAQGNPVTRVVPKADALNKDFARPDTAQTQTRKENAANVLAHIQDIESEAEQVDKLGLMGPLGGRWGDFMAGRIGAGELAAGNPQNAELLGQFRSDVGLLKSGMAMVHGGARGGGSPAIMARMDALMNAKTMDLSLFKGATTSFKKWLTQYAGKADAAGAGKAVRYDMNGNEIK